MASPAGHALAQAAGIITTVAGTGTAGFSGDGGPPTGAQLNGPVGLALHASRNLFIGDYNNNRIRRVDLVTGVITTVAGTGVAGFSGDGGPAAGAQFNQPAGLAVDPGGNLFIADRADHRIRKVAAGTGVITTVAGTGTPGFSGDGGPATNAALNRPPDVALDPSENLFIADFNNHRIRRVDARTGVITTVAGTGTAGFSGDGGPATSAQLNAPLGVAVEVNGSIYIADTSNHRIRKVDPATGLITTVAGTGSGRGTFGFSGDGGPATGAQLNFPFGVLLDPSGNLFIADKDNHRIRKVTPGTGLITTVAGTQTAVSGGFAGDGGPATSAQLAFPNAIVLDASGNLFIAEFGNNRVRRVAGLAAPTCPEAAPPAGSSLTISRARGHAGDMVPFPIMGAPGENAVAAFSRANSGASFRGQALFLGPDLAALFTCQLPAAGACSQTVTIPPGIEGTFFFQAGRSADPTFQAGAFSLTNAGCITIQ